MKKRSWFFSSPETTKGTRFNKNNIPSKNTFYELLDSVPFFNDSESTASETQTGMLRIATNAEVIARAADIAAVIPSQIPEVIPYNSEVDTAEVSRFGIGILKNAIGNRENYLLKMRADTLGSIYTAAVTPFVVLSLPDMAVKADRTKKMGVDTFVSQYVINNPLVTENFGLTANEVQTLIDEAISRIPAVEIPEVPVSIDAEFRPDNLIKVGTSEAGTSRLILKHNGNIVPIDSVDDITIPSFENVAFTKLLDAFGNPSIQIDDITATHGFVRVSVPSPDESRNFIATLYLTKVDASGTGDTDPPIEADPTYTIEVSLPTTRTIDVDVNNSILSSNKDFLIKVLSDNGSYVDIIPADIQITGSNATMVVTQLTSSTLRATLDTITLSTVLDVNSSKFVATNQPVAITLNKNEITVPVDPIYTFDKYIATQDVDMNSAGGFLNTIKPFLVITIQDQYDAYIPLTVDDIQVSLTSGTAIFRTHVLDIAPNVVYLELLTLTSTAVFSITSSTKVPTNEPWEFTFRRIAYAVDPDPERGYYTYVSQSDVTIETEGNGIATTPKTSIDVWVEKADTGTFANAVSVDFPLDKLIIAALPFDTLSGLSYTPTKNIDEPFKIILTFDELSVDLRTFNIRYNDPISIGPNVAVTRTIVAGDTAPPADVITGGILTVSPAASTLKTLYTGGPIAPYNRFTVSMVDIDTGDPLLLPLDSLTITPLAGQNFDNVTIATVVAFANPYEIEIYFQWFNEVQKTFVINTTEYECDDISLVVTQIII
jgi:hypothetical protein